MGLLPNVTNKFGLPEEMYAALTKNRYVADDDEQDLKTDFSISALTAPTRQTILRQRHPGANTEDCTDRLFSMFGSIAHALLEEHGSDDSITEKRIYKQIKGITISGAIDHYKNRVITDYKVTSVFKIMRGNFDDWAKQQNCYATLCEDAGLPVDSIRIVAILRDWSRSDAKRIYGYPKANVVVIPLVKWSKEARERYLIDRVSMLKHCAKIDDDQLPECSDDERWCSHKDWAILKDGQAKAVKCFEAGSGPKHLYRTKEEAYAEGRKEFVAKYAHDSKYSFVERRSDPKRCIDYCSVSSVCSQYQEWLSKSPKKGGEKEYVEEKPKQGQMVAASEESRDCAWFCGGTIEEPPQVTPRASRTSDEESAYVPF